MKKFICLMSFILLITPLYIFSQEIFSIDDCIGSALKNNSQLNNARHNLGIANAGKLGSYASILPYISVNASSQQSQVSTSTYLRDVPIVDANGRTIGYEQKEVTTEGYDRNFHRNSISWSQTIFDGGAWWNEIQRGYDTESAAEYNLENTILNTITLVRQRYLELLQQIKQLEVLVKSVEMYEQQLERSESMYRVGSVAQADVFQAQVSLGNEKIRMINQQNAVDVAKANLNVAMGREPSEPITIDENAFENAPYNEIDFSLEETINRALSLSPELKSLHQTIESNEKAVKIAKSSRYPVLEGSFSYSRNNSLFKRVYGDFDKNYSWNYSGQVRLILFDGFQTKSNIRREQENVLIANENYENRKRTLTSEIKQVYNNYKAAQTIMELNEANIKAAEENLRLNTERYRVGAGTLLETVVAQVNLTSARSTYVQNKYNLLIYQFQLKALLGMIDDKYYEMANFDNN